MDLTRGREPSHARVVGVDGADQPAHAGPPRGEDLLFLARLGTPVVPGYGGVPQADHHEEVALDEGLGPNSKDKILA